MAAPAQPDQPRAGDRSARPAAAWRGSSSRSWCPRRPSPAPRSSRRRRTAIGRSRRERLVEPGRAGQSPQAGRRVGGGDPIGVGHEQAERQPPTARGGPPAGRRGAPAGAPRGRSPTASSRASDISGRLANPAGDRAVAERPRRAWPAPARSGRRASCRRHAVAPRPSSLEEPATSVVSESSPAGVPGGGIGEAPNPGRSIAITSCCAARAADHRLPHLPPAADPVDQQQRIAVSGAMVVEVHAADLASASRDARRPLRFVQRRRQTVAAASNWFGEPANYRCTKRPRQFPEEISWRAPRRQPRPSAARSRSSRAGTCGCTSRGCRPTSDHEVPIIVRGEGCYVYDEHGNRYLDGLSALFCVNIGHGRADIAQAGADQAKELGFFTNWSYAHPRAIELAARIAGAGARRPEPGVLHQRRQRGRRVGAQAGAPVPQAHRQPEQDQGDRSRDRLPRHQPRRAVGDRDHQPARAVRAAHARRLPRPQHQHLPAARTG